ncbi:MAG: HigA family addiction module antitoxin [Acidaminococcaceae bacterium]
MIKFEYKEIIAFHPGYYVKDIIEDLEMNQCEFAKRLEITEKTLSKLLSGEAPMSREIAKKMSQMLGTSVDVWLELQKKYEDKCCQIEQLQKLERETKCLEEIDYSYFSKLNVVAPTKDKKEKVQNLRKYLQVASLCTLGKPDLLAACKTSVPEVEVKHVINANAWIQTGINFAKNMICDPFDGKKLKEALMEIRQITMQDPTVFYPRLKKMLAECGVALVALPYLRNSGINGAVKWLKNDKVLLLINDRKKTADLFWFALFHELKHILQNRKKAVYISYEHKADSRLTLGAGDADSENDANEFAANFLLPPKQYQKFIAAGDFSEEKVKSFAEEVGVNFSIIIGRLQHDGHVDWKDKLSGLKEQYVIG